MSSVGIFCYPTRVLMVLKSGRATRTRFWNWSVIRFQKQVAHAVIFPSIPTTSISPTFWSKAQQVPGRMRGFAVYVRTASGRWLHCTTVIFHQLVVWTQAHSNREMREMLSGTLTLLVGFQCYMMNLLPLCIVCESKLCRTRRCSVQHVQRFSFIKNLLNQNSKHLRTPI